MKLFRLLSTTAVTVLAIAALAVSASAMTATYDATTGKVTISGITLNESAEQKTLLILNEDATTVAEDDIVQIDQAADFTTVTVGNLSADIDADNQALLDTYATIENPTTQDYANLTSAWTYTDEYYIRVGGNGVVDETTKVAYDAYTLVVDTTVVLPEAPQPDEPEYTLGDIDNADGIDATDASLVLQSAAGMLTLTSTQTLAADVDGADGVDATDASLILQYAAGMIDTFPASK